MRRLMRADLKRITKRTSVIVIFVLMLILGCFTTIYDFTDSLVNGLKLVTAYMDSFAFSSFCFGLVILSRVYLDDFRAAITSGVIGRGISRGKYVVVKFLDSVVLFFCMHLFLTLVVYATGRGMGAQLTPDETRMFLLYFVTEVIGTAADITIAALFLFLTGRAALCVFVYTALYLIAPLVVYFAQMSSLDMKYHFTRYYVIGMLNNSFTVSMFGEDVKGALLFLLTALIYIGLPLFVSGAVFNKMEMEF